MSKISIRRKHSMNPQALAQQVEQLAEKIATRYGGSYGWQGDALMFQHDGGVDVCIQCTGEEVAVDARLGMLASMMKGKLTSEIEDYLDKHIS